MKQVFLILLLIPAIAIAQKSSSKKRIPKPFFKPNALYISIDMGFQKQIGLKKLFTLADLNRSVGGTGTNWSALDVNWNFNKQQHLFFGVDIIAKPNLDIETSDYLNTKFAPLSKQTYSSENRFASTYTYLGYGKAFNKGKYTILPYATIGIFSVGLLHDKYLYTSNTNNAAFTYFVDYDNTKYRNLKYLNIPQYTINTRLYKNLTKLTVYAEASLRYYNANLDLITLERNELTKATINNIYKYGSHNVNAGLKLGVSYRFSKW